MYFGASPGLEWTSHDDGERWVRGAMPCETDLGGNFDPVSRTVIWAFCATGTAGAPLVSTNGGTSFVDAGGTGGGFWNGAMVAALSSRYAFVGAGNSALQVTANAGQSYRSISQFPNVLWVGFTDSEVGYVITLDQTTNASQLWRTSDAGTTWHTVSLA
jgi:xyloglucan-specific exo-beta-1,4-glucanase